jgi:hypothetical protein
MSVLGTLWLRVDLTPVIGGSTVGGHAAKRPFFDTQLKMKSLFRVHN